MDLQLIITQTPMDYNPITIAILRKRKNPHDIPNNTLVDELNACLKDENNYYLIDEE